MTRSWHRPPLYSETISMRGGHTSQETKPSHKVPTIGWIKGDGLLALLIDDDPADQDPEHNNRKH